MPDNPMSGKAGNTTRLNQMLSYFNNFESVETTFVSLQDWGQWKEDEKTLFSEIYPNIELIILNKKYKQNFFKYFFLYKLPYLFRKNPIDMTSWILRKEFAGMVNTRHFDNIIISYATWGNIISNVKTKSNFIIDTHDFITAQYSSKCKNIGKLFQSEIGILKKFDEIWTYSVEEEYIFGQFTNKKVKYLPIPFPQKPLQPLKQHYTYDVVYVASNNPHNVHSIKWFLDHVLSYLDNSITIHIIGKVGKEIKKEYPNVKVYGMVEDLHEFYENARITICPMLSGTGVKIKVLESLSNNLPVVTNTRGVDGLSQKNNNGCLVTDDAKEFAEYIDVLLKNDEVYEELRQKAHEFIKNNHSLEKEIVFFRNKFS
jgi:glycosyltransferase involved in cell wall biosynthesis